MSDAPYVLITRPDGTTHRIYGIRKDPAGEKRLAYLIANEKDATIEWVGY